MKKTLLGVFCSALLLPAIAFGQTTHNFTAASGAWEDAANWDVGTVPADGDSAFVNNGGTADLSTDSSIVLDIGIGQGFGVEGHLVHSAGTLSSADGWIRIGGDGGTGSYIMTGTAALEAIHINPGDQRVFIGHGQPGNGVLEMSDGTSIRTSGDFVVGDGADAVGEATLNDDANVTCDGNCVVGAGGSEGTITLNGGSSIIAGGLRFAGSGSATININDDAIFEGGSVHFGNVGATITVNHTGGRLSSNQWIGIANDGGGDVTYNLSCGQLISNGDFLTVGEDGNGSLNVSGTGEVQANGEAMFIGRNDNSNGRLTVIGSTATVTVNDLRVDRDGTVGNTAGIGFVADAGGISPIVSADNTEFGDSANLVLDLTADANFASFDDTTGTPLEIVLIRNAAASTGTFTGLPEGATVSIGGSKSATLTYVGGAGNDIALNLFMGMGGGGFVPPAQYTVFRGIELNGAIGDYSTSDDVRASYNPGFVINNTEAPVWLVFDGNAAGATSFRVESQAGTPGLTYTMEAFNFVTGQLEVIGTQDESFNNDVVTTFPIGADNVDTNGDVRSRVGWRQTGFTINFPWVVQVDQVGWNQ